VSVNSEVKYLESELATVALLKAVEKVIPKDIPAQQVSHIRDMCTTFSVRSSRRDKARTGPVRQTFRLFGDKWAPLVVMVLECGAMRYLALHNLVSLLAREGGETGISQRMLTLVLRNLEMNGMLARSSQSATAHRGVYFLTPLGRSLGGQMMQMIEWAERHSDEINLARSTYAGPDPLGGAGSQCADDDCAHEHEPQLSVVQSR
jgi:DNA-binding HxlR family transcriptional regulator